MAVNKDPILKRCRYLGISPAVMGVSKKESIRFKNANNRKKISEYGLQLKEVHLRRSRKAVLSLL